MEEHLLCKRGDLTLDPYYPCGKPGTVAWACKPSRGEAETENPWSSLASWSSGIGELQVQSETLPLKEGREQMT